MGVLIGELWTAALYEAWMIARGERLAELRGDRLRRFDSRGIHPYSFAWGRIVALEALDPTLQTLRLQSGAEACDPVSMASAARDAAQQDFVDQIRQSAA